MHPALTLELHVCGSTWGGVVAARCSRTCVPSLQPGVGVPLALDAYLLLPAKPQSARASPLVRQRPAPAGGKCSRQAQEHTCALANSVLEGSQALSSCRPNPDTYAKGWLSQSPSAPLPTQVRVLLCSMPFPHTALGRPDGNAGDLSAIQRYSLGFVIQTWRPALVCPYLRLSARSCAQPEVH